MESGHPLVNRLLDLIADYSQIELGIAAKISGDTEMLSAYAEGRDLHTLTARSLTGNVEVSNDDRKLAKAVNFGLLYGMGAKGLQSYALKSYGIDMTALCSEVDPPRITA
jgi:DNA polymerase-1